MRAAAEEKAGRTALVGYGFADTVQFEPRDGRTDVIVSHERIGSEAARNEHEKGWFGCIDGLAKHVELPQ